MMVSAPVRWTAFAAAAVVPLVVLWGQDRSAPAPQATRSEGLASAAPVQAMTVTATETPPARMPAASPQPPAAPYSYVGSWREGGRLHLYLRRGDVTVGVDGLGSIGDDYAVIAADEDRVTLKYLPLGTVQVLQRVAPLQPMVPSRTHTPAPGNASPDAPAEN